MARSTYPLFPSDDGWPYPDATGAAVVGGGEPMADDPIDLDILELQADAHVFASLTESEHDLITRRFGFGCEPQSMKAIAAYLGCTHAEAADRLGQAIDKVRSRLRPS